MSEPLVQLIDEALDAINGEVLDKTRAIDRLLDMRLVADSPALVAAIDEQLAGLPGKTMVASTAWADALNALRLFAELEGEKTVTG
jgi:hypothetical protein